MTYKSKNDCGDCEWLAHETEGDFTQGDECALKDAHDFFRRKQNNDRIQEETE